jgi:hypothetical protein
MANLPAASGERTADRLPKIKARYPVAAREVDNDWQPVELRAPMAEMEQMVIWLIAEVEQWRGEADEWRTTAQAGAEVLADRDAEIDHLRGHLAAVEWAAADAAGAPAQAICPACRVLKPGPHSPGCFIARAIRTRQ